LRVLFVCSSQLSRSFVLGLRLSVCFFFALSNPKPKPPTPTKTKKFGSGFFSWTFCIPWSATSCVLPFGVPFPFFLSFDLRSQMHWASAFVFRGWCTLGVIRVFPPLLFCLSFCTLWVCPDQRRWPVGPRDGSCRLFWRVLFFTYFWVNFPVPRSPDAIGRSFFRLRGGFFFLWRNWLLGAFA